MKKLLSLFVLLFWAGSGHAQTTVRSGEHGDFTRLVLSLEQNQDWSVSRTLEGKALVVQLDNAASFDLSSVYDRIGRDRVQNIRANESQLEIDLGCDCAHKAFQIVGPYLVIDIQDGEPPKLEIAQPPESHATQAETAQRAALSALRVGSIPGLGPATSHDVLFPNNTVLSEVTQPERESNRSASIGNIDRSIFQGIARAASEGLLDATSQKIVAPPDISPAVVPDKSSQHPHETDPSQDLQQQLEKQLASFEAGEDDNIVIGGSSCADPDMFRLSDWDETDKGKEAPAKPSLFGEFDRVNPGAVVSQTQALLGAGFGAEARMLLSLLDDPAPELLALSYGVDGESDPESRLLGQQDCDGPAAMWSVLTSEDLDLSKPVNRNAVIRHFESLPPHLREYLGPELARKLTSAGLDGMASDILRRLQRMQGKETPSISLARAEIEISRGQYDQAVEELLPLARSSGPETVGAVIAAVEASHEAGKPVAKDIAQLTEAFSEELRGDRDGPSLWRANILALLDASEFDKAFLAISDSDGISEDLLFPTEDDLTEAVVNKASDFVFLKYALSERLPSRSLGKAKVTEPYLNRLVSLGLYENAVKTIDALPALKKTREIQMLQARALLALSRPEAADMILIGMQGDDVLSLRAEVRLAMGDYDFAKTAYARLGAVDRERDAAWLAGDWQEMSKQDDIRGQAVKMAMTELPQTSEGGVSLADAEALSSSSGQTRSIISALLEETRIPDS